MDYLPTVLTPPIPVILPPTPPSGVRYKAPKGHSETQFEHDLNRYFPGKIHTGLMMQRSGLNHPYIPDLAYLDPEQALAIDIEVDEPYTHTTRQPLHYAGCPKDAQRNQWFLEQGWLVIRFSEAQVVQSPAGCCKTIASAIASITGNSAIMAPFRQVRSLKPEPRWTQTEAEAMAAQNYREQYIAQAAQHQAPPSKRQRKRGRDSQVVSQSRSLQTTAVTFFCPECGEGPIRWQGHYVCCSTCHYDAFVL
jgi:very-short-patch-repair endonuclease/predicted RNA-binding Zn-ribbon protein involved in translation (DUF1610 family)